MGREGFGFEFVSFLWWLQRGQALVDGEKRDIALNYTEPESRQRQAILTSLKDSYKDLGMKQSAAAKDLASQNQYLLVLLPSIFGQDANPSLSKHVLYKIANRRFSLYHHVGTMQSGSAQSNSPTLKLWSQILGSL